MRVGDGDRIHHFSLEDMGAHSGITPEPSATSFLASSARGHPHRAGKGLANRHSRAISPPLTNLKDADRGPGLATQHQGWQRRDVPLWGERVPKATAPMGRLTHSIPEDGDAQGSIEKR